MSNSYELIKQLHDLANTLSQVAYDRNPTTINGARLYMATQFPALGSQIQEYLQSLSTSIEVKEAPLTVYVVLIDGEDRLMPTKHTLTTISRIRHLRDAIARHYKINENEIKMPYEDKVPLVRLIIDPKYFEIVVQTPPSLKYLFHPMDHLIPTDLLEQKVKFTMVDGSYFYFPHLKGHSIGGIKEAISQLLQIKAEQISFPAFQKYIDTSNADVCWNEIGRPAAISTIIK